MKATDWKKDWDGRGRKANTDLTLEELLNLVLPKEDDSVLDAGCGIGGNLVALSSRVRQVVGIDFSKGAVEECQRRIDEIGLGNAEVREGSVTRLPLADASVDKVLCMSVLQYCDEKETISAFAEFARV